MLSNTVWDLFIASEYTFEEVLPKVSLNVLMKLLLDLEKSPEDKKYALLVEGEIQKRMAAMGL